MSWDDRGNVVYVWNAVRRCIGYAIRKDDGTWQVKLSGSKRLAYGPYKYKESAVTKLARLVTHGT